FWQCDFDTIGTTSNAADIEVVLVINDLMVALGFDRFRIHVNNRLVLNGLLEELGLAGQTKTVLIPPRKLPKIGAHAGDAEKAERAEKAGVQAAQANRLLTLAQTQGANAEILAKLRADFGGNAKAADGVRRLEELLTAATTAGVPDERIRLDLSIARGLDYYTCTIYETFLSDLPRIGSVSSARRYDHPPSLHPNPLPAPLAP